jgi:hypothetical protein
VGGPSYYGAPTIEAELRPDGQLATDCTSILCPNHEVLFPNQIREELPTNRPESSFWTRKHLSGHPIYEDSLKGLRLSGIITATSVCRSIFMPVPI